MSGSNTSNSQPSVRFKTVLLLEDDPGHALLIQRVLKNFSPTVTHVTHLAEALKKLSTETYSLVISDLHVPDAQDQALIGAVLKSAKSTPVLVLTSSTDLTVAVDAMKLGAKDYIVKNFNNEFKDVFSLALEKLARAMEFERERLRLQHEMAVIRIAIENSGDGLAILNLDETIEFSNSSFQEFVSLWGGKCQSLSTLFTGNLLKTNQTETDLRSHLDNNQSGSYWSTEINVGGNKNLSFRLELAPLFNARSTSATNEATGTQDQWVLWLRDISDEKRREKFQREILSTTTHDLKGPLGAILLSADLIGSDPTRLDRVKELSLRIGSSAQGAVNLIDEFLSARRLQEGTFILKPTHQRVQGLLEETAGTYETIIKAKGLTLLLECTPNDLSASFDKLGMSRVIGNLVSNAQKFTSRGGTITVSAIDLETEYKIAVKDTGSGIEPAEIKKLFEKFSRLSQHSDVDGTGLGLFVVKCIVTAHGGRISVSSTPGVGTSFEIVLPKEPPMNSNGELISLDFA